MGNFAPGIRIRIQNADPDPAPQINADPCGSGFGYTPYFSGLPFPPTITHRSRTRCISCPKHWEHRGRNIVERQIKILIKHSDFLSTSQQEVSADIIQNPAVRNFSPNKSNLYILFTFCQVCLPRDCNYGTRNGRKVQLVPD